MREVNKIKFDFLVTLKKGKVGNNKYVYIYEEDNMTLDSTKTSNYFNYKNNEKIDLSSVKSSWDSQKLLVAE